MIEISKLLVKYDQSTFQPEFNFECNLKITTETMQDVDAVPAIAEAFYKKLGEELYKKVRSQAGIFRKS